MQNKEIIATHKIIMFVVFICAALITSLFLFHLREKKAPLSLAPEAGILFPVPRDIKSFDLVSTHHEKFTSAQFYNHWTLLFFGFTHCSFICPNTLEVMNRAYSELHQHYPDLQVVMVSLDPARDSLETLTNYVHQFNPQFIGVTGKVQELRKLQSQLGVFSSQEDTNSSNYQIQHTSSIMLINPEGKWAGLFKFGLNPKQLSTAFSDSVNKIKNVSKKKSGGSPIC